MMDDTPPARGNSPVEDPREGSDWDTAARVVQLLEVVQRFAVLDFSETAPVGDAGDDLDALAAGINMLGEELDGWNRDFNERVTRRTMELDESVRQLRRSNEQISKLTELSNALQVARDRDEALDALARFVPAIFGGTSGALYLATGAGQHFEAATAWGPHEGWFPSVIRSETCSALRDARMHRGRGQDAASCAHVPPAARGRTLCVPFAVRDTVLGLLSLRDSSDDAEQVADPAEARSTHARLALVASEQFALAVANLELRDELRAQSIRDVLTGLYNRRYLDETLDRELRRARRTGAPVSVLMLDLDEFKRLNDAHGHAAGDAVLTDVAAVLLGVVRSEDVVCRYGGEEFAVIVAGPEQAEAVERAQQIRNEMAVHRFSWQEQPLGGLTASIGVATSPQNGTTADQLLAAADTALYRAKGSGRNRVVAAT